MKILDEFWTVSRASCTQQCQRIILVALWVTNIARCLRICSSFECYYCCNLIYFNLFTDVVAVGVTDDTNTMSLTTLHSAQIAEWS
jgi:hypothetical protein